MQNTIKNSLVVSNLAVFTAANGIRINSKKIKSHYNLIASICRGDVTIEDVSETPTPNVEKLAEQYEKVNKKAYVYYKDVKKAYPDIANTLKTEIFKNKDRLSVEDILQMIEEIEPEDKFWISFDRWEGAQKDLNQKQVVVQLNMDQKLIKEIEENPTVNKFFDDFFKSVSGQHPFHGQTLAWARIYKFPDKWIIEELQNDIVGADIKTSDKIEKLVEGYTQEQLQELGNFFYKHFTDWDKKLVSTIIDMARNEKVPEIWIFDEDIKKEVTRSKSKLARYYRQVPRDLGFKKDTLKVEDNEIPAWKRPVAKLKK